MTGTPPLTNEEKRVLTALRGLGAAQEGKAVEVERISEEGGLESVAQARNAVSWLEAKRLVRIDDALIHEYELTPEGRRCVERRLPERRALDALAAKGTLTLAELSALPSLEPHERGVAVGKLREMGLIEIGPGKRVTLTAAGREKAQGRLGDEVVLEAIHQAGRKPGSELDAALLAPFLKRPHLFKRHDVVHRRVRLTQKGAEVAAGPLEIVETANAMTPEYLRSGAWRATPLRPYDVSAFAPALYGGKMHPMRQIIERVRRIFLDMGFTEIQGDYVRTAFWNLDALFVPQDHPAREMQDTFYLDEPRSVSLDDEPLVGVVQKVHEDGGDTGSTGWGGTWDPAVASQLLLRTHTTVDTIAHLAKHPKPPQRIFTIGRVFRKERIDAKHLPEFHQIEGIIVEEGANLAMLIGTLREFYRKMGFPDVRIRPSYFPYTEPSLEVEVLHPKLGWLELGGAGVFRPEVTEPLGVPCPVLAWGQGLERLAMITLGLDDIRQLYISDVDWLRTTPQIL